MGLYLSPRAGEAPKVSKALDGVQLAATDDDAAHWGTHLADLGGKPLSRPRFICSTRRHATTAESIDIGP